MASTSKKKLPFEKRARSVPFKRPFIKAAFLGALFYLLLLAVLTSIGVYFMHQSKFSVMLLLGCFGLTIFVWIIGLFKRRSACCPSVKAPHFSTPERTFMRRPRSSHSSTTGTPTWCAPFSSSAYAACTAEPPSIS